MEPKDTLFRYLNELKDLDLPKGKFAIFGSGPLAIRNIREPHDLDIIVKRGLWDVFVEKYPQQAEGQSKFIKIGDIEIRHDWANLSDKIDEIIDNAEMIENFPFVRLNYVLEWKEYANREKDKNDIRLIKDYLSRINYENNHLREHRVL